MVHMFRVMSARCPTPQIGTTSLPRATATHSQAQQAIEPETIQVVHTIMEQVIPSTQVLVVVNSFASVLFQIDARKANLFDGALPPSS